jgi:ribonuclease P protein component
MLARENRIRTAADFRHTLKSRRRVRTYTLVNIHPQLPTGPTRIGFILTKKNGNAVTRNLIKRRLREIGAEFLKENPTGYNAVIRALPTAKDATFADLRTETLRSLNTMTRKDN